MPVREKKFIQYIKMQITDQENRLLDLNDEPVKFILHLRSTTRWQSLATSSSYLNVLLNKIRLLYYKQKVSGAGMVYKEISGNGILNIL